MSDNFRALVRVTEVAFGFFVVRVKSAVFSYGACSRKNVDVLAAQNKNKKTLQKTPLAAIAVRRCIVASVFEHFDVS